MKTELMSVTTEPSIQCDRVGPRLSRSPWVVFISLVLGLTFGVGCQRSTTPIGPDAEVVRLMNQGVSRMGHYQYNEAVEAFEAVIARDPELVDAQVNLAMALFNRARKEDLDVDRSGEILSAVLAKDPGHLRALYFRGIVLQHMGQAEAAVPCFEQVVAQRPDDGAAWYLLGLCQQRLGQPAKEALLKAVAARPYLYSAYYKLYQIAVSRGETEEAKEYIEKFKALRQNPLGEAIELPQYNQMGELALAVPLTSPPAPPVTTTEYSARSELAVLSLASAPGFGVSGDPILRDFGGVAAGDVNQDGQVDFLFTVKGTDGGGRLGLMLSSGDGWRDGMAGSGLESVRAPVSCSLGDYDNDGTNDLFVACAGENVLLRGAGGGRFEDVTEVTGVGGGATVSRSALFLDADHDGDLDLWVANGGVIEGGHPVANSLWNNNADGSFTNIAESAGVALPESDTVLMLPGDLDGDRDMDGVILRRGETAQVYLNELLGRYQAVQLEGLEIRGDLGGALQDFNGDGELDLVVLGGDRPMLRFFAGDGKGGFRSDEAFAGLAKAVSSWGPLRAVRALDVDLDGDLDLAVFATAGNLLLNDGRGQFVLRPKLWVSEPGFVGAELLDVNADLVPDWVRLDRQPTARLVLMAGQLVPPSTGLALAPTGMRGRDKRTRSPASGYGVKLSLQAGLREQTRVYTGLHGGSDQSSIPVVLGLGGAGEADYVQLNWTDGVAQVESALSAGETHRVSEMERKISSCPVLFSWNGERFQFVTDFAGVGGLGYFVAPGEAAPPQVLEHIKIEPGQLRGRDGVLELRVTEPMEESAYVDRLELVAVDHSSDWSVYPDERLAIRGPAPTHELLVLNERWFPLRASDPDGADCTERLLTVDRHYAYAPRLDRRFIGFCEPHTLELDFGKAPADLKATDRLTLCIQGFIEYPYSQTVYAAGQAHVGWEPIRVEQYQADGTWQVLVPDAGAPGGMARMMTIPLDGMGFDTPVKLRLTTNLEVFYDQVFLAWDLGADRVVKTSVPLASAELRRVGFAREFSPDGRLPLIYDYELSDASAPFHVLRGDYTRYGAVEPLLKEYDDRYVIVGPGDEIALRFDPSGLPELKAGHVRSYILISHAYCKDMDLYTATPETLEPLPFRGMSRYPYPENERFPDTPEHQAWREAYNTRVID